MSQAKRLTDVSCVVKQIRDKAIAVADGTTERLVWYWLPKSIIQVEPAEYDVGDNVIVTLPEAIAVEKGLV